MRWWIWLLIVLFVMLAVIILLWRESRLRSTAVRSPAHAKVPGNIPETERPPIAERETVTAPTAKPDVPATSPEPAAATDPGQDIPAASPATPSAPSTSAGTTTAVTEPQAHVRPATPGTASPGTQRTAGAFVADSPRTADTTRYQPSTTSEWASGDSSTTTDDQPGAEDSAGIGTPQRDEASLSVPDAEARTPDVAEVHETAAPEVSTAAPDAAAEAGEPRVPETPATADGHSGIGGAALAGSAAVAGGAAIAHHHEEQAPEEDLSGLDAEAGVPATASRVTGPEGTATAGPEVSGATAEATDDWFQALGRTHTADGGDNVQAEDLSGSSDGRGVEDAGIAAAGLAGGAALAHHQQTESEPTSTEVTPEAAPRRAPVAMPYGPGSATPLADGSAPSPGYGIKASTDTMRYHTHESPGYHTTRHQVWFSTEAAASAAGFRPWNHEERERARQSADTAPPAAPLSPYGSDSGFSRAATAAARPVVPPPAVSRETTAVPHDARTDMNDEEPGMADRAETTAPAETKTPTASAAVPAPRTDVPEGPHGPGSAHPLEDGSAPAPHFVIKGNTNSMLYHGEESQGFHDTRAEVWFETEQHAEAAGYKAWNWRSRDRKARQAAKSTSAPAAAAPAAASASVGGGQEESRNSSVATVTEAAPEALADVTTGTDSAADVAAAVPAPRDEETSKTPEANATGSEDDNEPTPTEETMTETENVAKHHDGIPHGPHGEGSAHPREDGSSPHERFHVKGNDDSGLYHTTDSPHYGRTGAEVWFASNEHAEAAGYKHWNHRKGDDREDLVPHGPHGPGSAHPREEDASAPHSRFHVKGNDDSGLYHTTDSPHYGRTGAEVWFASEEHARAAGYKHWDRKKREAE